MTSYSVDEKELMKLNVGDFVAILTHHMGDGKTHWTLGTVNSPPYLRDVEIRLWEKQRFEYYNEGDVPVNEETEALMKRIAQVKSELQQSIAEADGLTEKLRGRRASIMEQIGQADEYVAESRAVMHAARDDVESIPDRHWQELKSYRIPPKMVALVIRAVMLLLSEDEARTWPQMQRVLRDFNFKSRITGYNPEQQLSPERREYILQECVSKKSFRYDRALQGSVAVGPIYYWVLAQLDCGEAQSQKSRVNKEVVSRQKELRSVLKQINEQQERIAEYQELIDDLDEQLRKCNQYMGTSPSRSSGGQSASRNRGQFTSRYQSSFAGEQSKEYLKSAFYPWQPTNRIIIVLRKNIVCNFGAVTSAEEATGYNLSDPQIHELDEAIIHSREDQERRDAEDDEARRLRELAEERNLERGLFERSATDPEASPRNDDEILERRKRNADEGKTSPLANVGADDVTAAPRSADQIDRLQRTFEGKNWRAVLDRKRDAIVSTFTEESAECLETPDYYISIVDLTIGSLIADFDVQHDGTRSKAELQNRVDAFGYPKVMALYEEESEAIAAEEVEESPEHQMKFGGDRWGEILPYHRAEMLEAFLNDTTAATGVPREEISVKDSRATEEDGLTIDYSVLNQDVTAEQVQEMVDRFEYPNMWALYQQLAGNAEPGALHQVRFRGERWNSLIQSQKDEIARAFMADTAEALGLSESSIQPEEMRYDRGLTVPYTVTNCPLNDDEIDQRVEDYNYPVTWSLYDRLLAEAAGASYQKAFKGENWEAVLGTVRPELSDAFRKDSAAALDVPVEDVEPCSLDTDQDRLLVSYNVVSDTVNPEMIRDQTKEFQYPEVWSLYDNVVEDQEAATAHMTRAFEGDLWSQILKSKQSAVQKAFHNDAVQALAVQPEQVSVLSTSADEYSLNVQYAVQIEGALAYDIQRCLDDFAFPEVWELYEVPSDAEDEKEAAAAADATEAEDESKEAAAAAEKHTKTFKDEDWKAINSESPERVQEAFREDTAKALNTSPENIIVDSVSADDNGLTVDYSVKDAAPVSAKEIEEKTDAAPYSAMNALLEKYEENKLVVTEHQVGFDGEDWKYVVENKRAQLEEAFVGCTVELFNLDKESLSNAKYSLGSLIVDFNLEHPASLTVDEINRKLNDCPYEPVWALYGDHPFDPNDVVQTTHELGFQGSGWQHVLESDENAVRQAIINGTAEAVEVPPENVVVKSIKFQDDALLVDVEVEHPTLQDKDLIHEQLEHNEFDELWKLYSEPEEEVDFVTTSHEVGFAGDDWKFILEDDEPRLQEVFAKSTAELFDVDPESISDTKLTANPNLIAQFNLTHDPALTEEEINDTLKTAEYRPVWDFYVSAPLNEDDIISTTHELGFEGESWESILNEQQEKLHDAIVQDTAKAVEIEPEAVKEVDLSVANDALVARVTLAHSVLQDSELIHEQLSSCPYPHVWALYEELASSLATSEEEEDVDEKEAAAAGRGAALSGSSGETRVIERKFDGDDWDLVLEHFPSEAPTAFQQDAANALSISPSNVRVVSMEVGSLIVKYQILEPEQDEETIQRTVDDAEFVELMKLYRSRVRATSEGEGGAAAADAAEAEDEAKEAAEAAQAENESKEAAAAAAADAGKYAKSFEGDHWRSCVAQKGPELEEAFKHDTAAALSTEPSNVNVASVAPEERAVNITYSLSPDDVPEEEVEEKVQNSAYPGVWEVYRSVAENETVAHPLSFEGDEWGFVVANRRWELSRALADDTSEAIGLPPDVVEDVQMDVSKENLAATLYMKYASRLSIDEVNQMLTDCPFERVWSLYKLLKPSGMLEKSFSGKLWTVIEEEKKEPLHRAFTEDVSNSLDISRLEVEVHDVQPHEKNIVFSYTVRASTLSDEQLHERAEEYPFPQVWALYKNEAESRGVTEFGAPSQTKEFAGKKWDNIVEDQRPEIESCFKRDTAEALHVPEDAVEVKSVYTTPEQLVVNYAVNSDEVSPETAEERTSDYAYPKMWNLYSSNRESKEMERRFEGDDWDLVLDNQRSEAEDAFKQDASNCLGVPSSSVVLTSMELGSLIAQYKIRESDLEDDEIQQRMDSYDFPILMALYKPRVRSADVGEGDVKAATPRAADLETTHGVSFEGDDWPFVMEHKGAKVHRALQDDAADAFQTDPANITDVQTSINDGALTANVTVKGIEEDESQAQTVLDEYMFPRTWDLYCPQSEAPRTSKNFEGEHWDAIVADQRPEFVNAFVQDTSKALDISPNDVDVHDVSATDGATADFSVYFTRATKEELDSVLESYPYPQVWALYKPADTTTGVSARDASEANFATTQHSVGFDGEFWDYTLSENKDGVRDAFVKETAALFNLEPENVQNLSLTTNERGLAVLFELKHPSDLSAEKINEQLATTKYADVWSLYTTPPPDSTEKVTTRHSVGFEGEEWDYTWENNASGVKQAFAEDVAEALSVEPADVTNVTREASPNGLLLAADVAHSPLLDSAMITEELAKREFKQVWELYETRPYDPDAVIETRHALSFEGSEWDFVMSRKSAEVHEALREDTATALEVVPENVTDVQTSVESSGLMVHVAVKHSPLQDMDLVQEELQHYAYERVWAYYCPASEARHLSKHFDGNWGKILEEQKDVVTAAFAEDTSKAANVAPEDVDVTRIDATSGLTVECATYFTIAPEEELKEAMEAYPFPQVWALYKNEAESRGVTEFGAPSQTKEFAGKEWDNIVEDQRPEIESCFKRDTAEALHVPEDAVEVKSVYTTPEQLVVNYAVNSDEVSPETAEERTSDYAYPKMWNLYSSNRESKEMERRFEGDDWDLVLDNQRSEAEDAFKQDASNCLGVPSSSVVLTSMELGSLIAQYKIRESDLEDDEIQQRMDSYDFPILMALYKPRVRSADVGEGDVKAATPRAADLETTHGVSFEGDDWPFVMEHKGAKVHRALQDDAADAFQTDPANITDVQTSIDDGALTANVTVKGIEEDESQAQTVLDEYMFPRTWDLYCPQSEAPRTSKNFEGEHWDAIVADQRPEFVNAFVQDTSKALDISPNDVDVHDVSATDGATADFSVYFTRATKEELDSVLESYPYPQVWALYKPADTTTGVSARDASEANFATTQHSVGFDGELWDYTLSENKDGVRDAFVKETAALFNLEPENVQNLSLTTNERGLAVLFELKHPSDLSAEKINEQLATTKYADVWSLYTTPPPDSTEKVTTRHSVGFEGEEWDYTWENNASGVKQAFAEDVAEALSVEPADVTNVTREASPNGLLLAADVAHSPLLDSAMITEELAKREFKQVWELYETRPYDPDAVIETRHALSFEGSEWDFVMSRKSAEVHEALREDTATALEVVPENVTDVQTSVESSGLMVHVAVKHSPLQDMDLVQEELQHYAYERVWAYYCPASEARHLSKHFDGNWGKILEEQKDVVTAAFAEDTSKAANVAPEDVDVTRIDATSGLTVECATYFTIAPEEELKEAMEAYPFPQVWALYKNEAESRGVTEFGAPSQTKEFAGKEWDNIVEDQRPEIESCFKRDTAEALHVPEDAVEVKSVYTTPNGLVVNYSVKRDDATAGETAKRTNDYAYPKVWALYQPEEAAEVVEPEEVKSGEVKAEEVEKEAPAAAPVAEPLVSTDLSVNFEGRDWDYVLENKAQQLGDAFKSGTARALGIPVAQVDVKEYVLGSLTVHFSALHPASMEEAEVRRLIDAYPYEEVWALYEEQASRNGVSTHDVGFEADNWEFINKVKHNEIVRAFIGGTATACSVSPLSVQAVEVTVFPHLMRVTCTVVHGDSIAPNAVNTAINRYPYEEVWALYEDAPYGTESAMLTRTFEGDAWGTVLETSNAALHQAFCIDTMNCLEVPRSSVCVKDMRTGSLLVDFTVRTNDLTAEEIERRTNAYPYPEVWNLYKPADVSAVQGVTEREDLANPSYQRHFTGPHWDNAVREQQSALKEAFAEDAAKILQTSPEDVQLNSLSTSASGLVVNYRTNKPNTSPAEVDEAVRGGEFSSVWALYHQQADEGYVSTQHEVAFAGEDWDYTVEQNAKALEDTFVTTTAEILDLRSRHVQNTHLSTSPAGLVVDCTLLHPPTMDSASISEKLRDASYGPVWELYETRPYDPSRVVVEPYSIAFEGEDWGYTLEQNRAGVEQAFIEETAAALKLTPDSVKGVRFEKDEDGIVVGCNITHSPLLDSTLARVELGAYPYTKVWNLYVVRPKASAVTTTHLVGFEGDHWRDVVVSLGPAVAEAVRLDTAVALAKTPENILSVSTDVTDSMMVATVVVKHPAEESNQAIQERLNTFDYARVWALYEDAMNPHVDVMKVRDNAGMSALMTKRFDGVDWDLAMDSYPEKIREAFILDTSDVLQCSSGAVVIDGTAIGSLVVQYRVRDLAMSEEKATSLTDNYAYPRVWALYKSRQSAADRYSTAGPPPALSHVSAARRSVVEPVREDNSAEEEAAAQREAEEAKRAAEDAKRAEQEAIEAAEAAQRALEEAESEAQKAEEEARRALEQANERRSAARRAAEAAQAEEDRRTRESLAEAQRALDAAQKAAAAAEEARRRRVKPLGAEEMMSEEESLVYLRKALAKAREERDRYQSQVEQAEARNTTRGA